MSAIQSEGQALLVGRLVGAVIRDAADPDSPFRETDVNLQTDGEGNYQPYFYVTVPSGRYMVTVVVVEDHEGANGGS